MGKLLEFRSTYSAIMKDIQASGFHFKVAGTLDGFVDLAVVESNGKCRTYNISCDEARKIADALVAVAEDVRTHCMYDRDALLTKDWRNPTKPRTKETDQGR